MATGKFLIDTNIRSVKASTIKRSLGSELKDNRQKLKVQVLELYPPMLKR